MKRIYIKDLEKKVGEEAKIAGFVRTIRDQGSIKFLIVEDVTGAIQVIVLKSSKDFEVVSQLSEESVVQVTGKVKEEKQAPGGVEIELKEVDVLSESAPELPIPVVVKGGDETEATKRFDYRWLDLRKTQKQKMFKIWTALERGFRDYFEKNGFIQIYTPSLMTAPSEGGAEVFQVDYFDRKAYLAQSPQFYKQMAMAAGFEKVFIVGPVYRAEPSFTTRHMTEFTGWDFEISYIGSHHDVMDALDDLLVAGFEQVKKERLLEGMEIPKIPFPRITMEEAKEKLKAAGIASKSSFDVSPEEEREICRIIKEETGHDFIYLIDWPVEGRPFYHMRHADSPDITMSFDLLYKGVEIVTGAQREHRVDVLEAQAKEKGIDLETVEDYLNFFRFGCPPHGGVGMGPARIIMSLLDLESIKEATFLPRDVKRLTP